MSHTAFELRRAAGSTPRRPGNDGRVALTASARRPGLTPQATNASSAQIGSAASVIGGWSNAPASSGKLVAMWAASV